MTTTGTRDRIDWSSERDRIDLVEVATRLLGPAPGRRGEKGRKSWWNCPLHDDQNPSFCVDPGKPWWRCWGCGESGDAATLVMRLEGLSFPEAIARLTGRSASMRTTGPNPNSPDATYRRNCQNGQNGQKSRPPESPTGLPEAEALALVMLAELHLWSPAGAEAIDYLTAERKLTEETIRTARLGWMSRVSIPKRDGDGYYHAQGITIPWFDGGRLSLIKIRQPEGCRPKYVEAFRDRPTLYPGTHVIETGRPLVIVEGEFDAILLGQELDGLASVVTLGGASNRPGLDLMSLMLAANPWYVATDSDSAGDKAADAWPARARRVRPPKPFKDWTEAKQAGIDLRRWWSDRLAGIEAPSLFTWDELAAQRWRPAIGEPDPGLVIDKPDFDRRREVLASFGDGRGDAFEGDL